MGKDILHRVGNSGHCGCETVSREVLPQVEIPEKWTQEPPCFAITIGVRLRSHTKNVILVKAVAIETGVVWFRVTVSGCREKSSVDHNSGQPGCKWTSHTWNVSHCLGALYRGHCAYTFDVSQACRNMTCFHSWIDKLLFPPVIML